MASDHLVSDDSTNLPMRSWLPKKHKPEAIIVALHGFNDYSRSFAIPAHYMTQQGIAVFAYDQRGFGKAPQTGIWAGEDNLIKDAADMVSAVKARYPGVPVYLMGESMGGAVAVVAVTHPGFPQVDGLILLAPALWGGDTMNPFVRASLWVAAHTWPDKMVTGEDLHIRATDNMQVLRALYYDPLVIKRTRVDAIYGMVELMDDAYADIGKVNVPILMLYGAHDQVIPPAPIVSALHKISAQATTAYYPQGYHMLLRDLHGDVPIHDIAAWVMNAEQPLPSGDEADASKLDPELKIQKNSPMWAHASTARILEAELN